jgi:hypothetical protein
MANGLFDKARAAFLDGNISWTGDNIKVVLVDDTYTANLATHEFLSDVSSTSRVSVSGLLTTKDSTNGVADADDVSFPLVPNNKQVKALIIFQENLDESSSKLIAYIDTATGLPFTGNGGPITLQWDNGANKIFKL